MVRKRAVVCAAGAGAAAIAIGFAVYTPVEDRFVRNDTTTTVEVGLCDSDPITIRPGHTEAIQTNTGGPKQCNVDYGEPDARCLIVAHDVVALLSNATPGTCSGAAPTSSPR